MFSKDFQHDYLLQRIAVTLQILSALAVIISFSILMFKSKK